MRTNHKLALASLVAVAAASLSACTSATPDVNGARATIVAITSPGAAWTAGGQMLNTARDSGSFGRDGTIWKDRHANQEAVSYLTTWQTTVRPGQEHDRCVEAAAWLTRTGATLPGGPAAGSEHTPHPTSQSIVTHCVRALGRGGPDEAFSDTFASWPNTTHDGYRFGPYLEALGTGARHRILTATAVAVPDED